MEQDRPIYFDYAATAPVRPEAADALGAALKHFGNPSSRYEYGREAARRVKEDRETVARALGCAPAELYFTSCGTESDNWALRRGWSWAAGREGTSSPPPLSTPPCWRPAGTWSGRGTR